MQLATSAEYSMHTLFFEGEDVLPSYLEDYRCRVWSGTSTADFYLKFRVPPRVINTIVRFDNIAALKAPKIKCQATLLQPELQLVHHYKPAFLAPKGYLSFAPSPKPVGWCLSWFYAGVVITGSQSPFDNSDVSPARLSIQANNRCLGRGFRDQMTSLIPRSTSGLLSYAQKINSYYLDLGFTLFSDSFETPPSFSIWKQLTIKYMNAKTDDERQSILSKLKYLWINDHHTADLESLLIGEPHGA